MTYTKPTPNTDPNSFGTVDVTLDPSMSASTIQTKIDQAGTGGVIEWAGTTGAKFNIGTNMRWLTGQKHYTNNSVKIVCTNTSTLDSFINLKAPKGGGPPSTSVTISDLEFWGHVNVPNATPANAPRRVLVPWTNSFFRRVKAKGGSNNGILVSGDRTVSGIVIDTCEIAYNIALPRAAGTCGGWKVNELGTCSSAVEDIFVVKCTRVHHNQGHGGWFDIGCTAALYNNEFDNNQQDGLFWEVSTNLYARDNVSHDNTDNGLRVLSGYQGQIINNTFYGNGDDGIAFVQDQNPATRSSLVCPQLPHAGQNEGYIITDFDVLGNVLQSGETVNSYTTSHPGTINYSTTPVVDGPTIIPLARAGETDTALALASITKTVPLGIAQETDSALGLSPTIPPLIVPLNLATEREAALPLASITKTIPLGIAEETDSVFAPSVVLTPVIPGNNPPPSDPPGIPRPRRHGNPHLFGEGPVFKALQRLRRRL